MRKGALNSAAKELGCNKIAYAHHKEDVMETMMMSLFYEGRFYCFPPNTYLDRMDLTVIRPMISYRKQMLSDLKISTSFQYVKSCPMDGYTKRQYIKELIQKVTQAEILKKEMEFETLTVPDESYIFSY